MTTAPKNLTFEASRSSGRVSAILVLPPKSRALYVLAHGAGAGMTHRFLESVANGLAERGVGTFRYQFPYMEAGKNRPDVPAVAEATVRAAVEAATREAPGITLIAGGKSFGGRMTSNAQAKTALPGVAGLAFLGFPLHGAGRPDGARAAHLAAIEVPMLFLQGTRDALADLTLLGPICQKLGASATLHVLEGADHSFHVLKRSGRTDAELMEEALDTLSEWARHR